MTDDCKMICEAFKNDIEEDKDIEAMVDDGYGDIIDSLSGE